MRKKLPNRRKNWHADVGDPWDKLSQVHVSTGEYSDGSIGEIFLDSSKEGTFTRDVLHALALSFSLGLQHGVKLEQFTHAFRNFEHHKDAVSIIRSIIDALNEQYGPKS